jgi:hypothetical protein
MYGAGAVVLGAGQQAVAAGVGVVVRGSLVGEDAGPGGDEAGDYAGCRSWARGEALSERTFLSPHLSTGSDADGVRVVAGAGGAEVLFVSADHFCARVEPGIALGFARRMAAFA